MNRMRPSRPAGSRPAPRATATGPRRAGSRPGDAEQRRQPSREGHEARGIGQHLEHGKRDRAPPARGKRAALNPRGFAWRSGRSQTRRFAMADAQEAAAGGAPARAIRAWGPRSSRPRATGRPARRDAAAAPPPRRPRGPQPLADGQEKPRPPVGGRGLSDSRPSLRRGWGRWPCRPPSGPSPTPPTWRTSPSRRRSVGNSMTRLDAAGADHHRHADVEVVQAVLAAQIGGAGQDALLVLAGRTWPWRWRFRPGRRRPSRSSAGRRSRRRRPGCA